MAERHAAVAFLEQAHADAERWARLAGGDGGHWVIQPRYSDPRFVDGKPPAPDDCEILPLDGGPVVWVEVGDGPDRERRQAEVLLIQANNPAAVLRRIEHERTILAEHANEAGDCSVCARQSEERNGFGYAFHEPLPWPCPTVLALARAWGWDG